MDGVDAQQAPATTDGSATVRPAQPRTHASNRGADLAWKDSSDSEVWLLDFKRTRRRRESEDDIAPTDPGKTKPQIVAQLSQVEHQLAQYLTLSATRSLRERIDVVRPSSMKLDLLTGSRLARYWPLLADRFSAYELDATIDELTPDATEIATFFDTPADTDRPARTRIWLTICTASALVSHWQGLASASREWTQAYRACRGPQRLATSAARHVTEAARTARDAVVHEDPDLSREKIAAFARDWLGLKPTADNVEATAAALLDASFDDLDPDDDEVIKQLRVSALHQHRLHRPIAETQLRGYKVDHLERPIAGSGITVAECLVTPDPIEGRFEEGFGGWSDPRVDRVLLQLNQHELRVAMIYAHEGGATWQEAATLCGLDSQYGERVRRKLRRLGQKLRERGAVSESHRHAA